MRRYLPVLLMKIPWKMAEGEMPMAEGKIYNPERRGGASLTAWKYAGLSWLLC